MGIPADASNGPSTVPRHVAVIMDGNGRWARSRGLPRVAGHRKGLERARELIGAAGERGIRYVTLFVFSSENWRRPQQEVSFLLDLFLSALDREITKLHENKVRFRVIGDVAGLGAELAQRIAAAEEHTRANDGLGLTLAANYGGHWDITQACAVVARRAVAGEIDAARITPQTIERHLATRDLPEPDLFIRTGGEQRISNFLLWQLAYTELYFTSALWPDFDRSHFEQALAAYAGRQRRFGLTGEQVEAARNA
jgi:undecaprenyl diphosphate synthase